MIKLFGTLDKEKPDLQLCYYQAGVGTYFKPGVVNPMFTWLATILDEAVAWYLNEHVMDGYKFLMQNYRTGDKICIFGFSRGAYTARALAGMLHKVGLLGKDNAEQVPFAYKVYNRSDDAANTLAAGFKRTFARDVKVEFLGVFDTVASVGVLVRKNLPFTAANSAVKTFRHALSLDERRAKFQPNLYHRPSPNPDKDPQHASLHTSYVPKYFSEIEREVLAETAELRQKFSFKRNPRTSGVSGAPSSPSISAKAAREAELILAEDAELVGTDVLEVWFAGCHGDVGGSSVPDAVRLSLSQITLHWMLREIVAAQCGIRFDNDALALVGFDPTAPVTSSNPEDPSDAVQPMYDQLSFKPWKWAALGWWILEIIPLQFSSQDGKGVWRTFWRYVGTA
ncbi:hypothetical protein HWV62_103 [Athelia sp. TMB]|nr:hypothetical protein HWV62_103 [Athelia sp. TMB]